MFLMPDERREIQLKRPASHTTLDGLSFITLRHKECKRVLTKLRHLVARPSRENSAVDGNIRSAHLGVPTTRSVKVLHEKAVSRA